jgi:hypothetical protein
LSKKTNIIELNGKRYDATTGAMIETSTLGSQNSGNLDGVLSATATKKDVPVLTKTEQAPLKSVVSKPVMDIARSPAAFQHSHKPEHAKTLMRTAVQKPKPGLKRHTKAQATTSGLTSTTPATAVQPNVSLQQIDPKRQAAAQTTPKSELVRRFNPAAATMAIQTTASTSTASQATPYIAVAPTGTEQPSKPSLDIFEKALAQATSHQEQYHAPSSSRIHLSRRVKALALSSVAVVIVGGFLVYQNVGNINLFMASSKAGFQASLPSYEPSGFSVEPLIASTGSVAATFKSNSDNRSYTLSEKPSSWDSTTLRDTYVVSVAGENYQTIQAGGRIIYFYGNHNATWVNGGIWYQLQTSGALSDQQLIEIATSI